MYNIYFEKKKKTKTLEIINNLKTNTLSWYNGANMTYKT